MEGLWIRNFSYHISCISISIANQFLFSFRLSLANSFFGLSQNATFSAFLVLFCSQNLAADLLMNKYISINLWSDTSKPIRLSSVCYFPFTAYSFYWFSQTSFHFMEKILLELCLRLQTLEIRQLIILFENFRMRDCRFRLRRIPIKNTSLQKHFLLICNTDNYKVCILGLSTFFYVNRV